MIDAPFPPLLPLDLPRPQIMEIIKVLEDAPPTVRYLCCWVGNRAMYGSIKHPTTEPAFCNWVEEMLTCSSLNLWVYHHTGWMYSSDAYDMIAYRQAWIKHLITYLESLP